MMSGPDSAKRFVCDYLESDLPERLIRYRNYWSTSEEELPTPNGYKPYAPPSLEHMGDELPVVYTVIIDTPQMRRIDYTPDHDPVYRVTYDTRTFVWVRHEGVGDKPAIEVTTQSRDRLMTVVRAALLDHQCLSVAAIHENTEVRFDEGTLREEFSDLIAQKGDRWAAGGYLSYQLTIDEVVTRVPIGEVAVVDVSGIAAWRFLEED